MRMKRKIFYFNIVEVALALAIVGIGIAGIMALFPVALNASRDAIGDNNAPDIAEQMLTYIEAQANANVGGSSDWSTGFIAALPTARDTATLTNEVSFTPANKKTDNIYQSGDFFGVQQTTGTIVDFSAIIRIWRNDATGNSIPGLYMYNSVTPANSNVDVPIRFGARIFMEISWPAERPYGQREKRTYMIELFNPNVG